DERIFQKTVVEQVMDRLKVLITSGTYKVGDKIPTEQELAERFGIGRSSIREAIKIFQHLGILESRVPKGTFLQPRSRISTEAITWALLLGDDDMWEIIELREIIEQRSFAHLMERRDTDTVGFQRTVDSLQNEVDKMGKAVHDQNLDALVQADLDFHSAIIRAGGNKLFTDILLTLNSFMREEIRKTFKEMDDLIDVSRDHQQILDRIKSDDIAKATERHNAHFGRIKRLLTPGEKPKI
ncbi:MAG: FCD domain-containing protein, partial [Treponemataceae bacterium]